MSSDSEDDVPLVQRKAAPKSSVSGVDAGNGTHPAEKKPVETAMKADDSDSDDDVPLAMRAKTAEAAKPKAATSAAASKKAAAKKPPLKKRKAAPSDSESSSSDESDSDDEPKKGKKKAVKKPPPKKAKATTKRGGGSSQSGGKNSGKNDEIKWTTLEHHGVLFPPEYEPHGVKMLYDGKPVDLTPDQEECATWFAVMRDTDYVKKPQFIKNFWEGFQQLLGKKHIIQKIDLCDFTPIYDWQLREKEKKQGMTKEEKTRIKDEKMKTEDKYKYAFVDGKKEMLGNFRVEPPGLFRGRGEHPKMGKVKKRILPEDVTLNLGEDATIPPCPMPGHNWGGIMHNHTVTWMAYWKDPVDPKQFKYVWLSANSGFKAESDLQKYEKARDLKNHIDSIRADYTRKFDSKDIVEQQMAVATYLIDKLALRAGHDKDDDEADTVGCCSLKVENVEQIPPCSLKFDFLGKDSIRYENTVEVLPKVYERIGQFLKKDAAGRKKKSTDEIFEFGVSRLNQHLKTLMPGLSAKVFRTYNASVTLDALLHQQSCKGMNEDQKRAAYDVANKEVAILCNHQRAVPKAHEAQMEKMSEKKQAILDELKLLKDELKLSKEGKEGQVMKGAPAKDSKDMKVRSEDKVKVALQKKKAMLEKLEIQSKVKEELKTVALGTSKINYLDPRITVAWCKKEEVPMERMFNKSLLSKFFWAMDVDPTFRF